MPGRFPQPIYDRYDELCAIVEKHPHDIPLTVAAEYERMKPESLREMAFQGACPYALCAPGAGGLRRNFKVPTYTFFMWHTKGIAPQQ